MKVLLDTSGLVSAMLPDHIHHAQSRPWIERAKAGAFEPVIAGHSLVETYSVLTRLPRRPRITPADALQLIQQNVPPHATIVALSGDDYLMLIAELSLTGVAGGAVYDAVIAKAAEMEDVDQLLTLNVTHFQRVWAGEAGRVATPQTLAPP
jgi:predicted nucleic acid-binding protein